MTPRWQIWVAKQVLHRNKLRQTADPPIIVRDLAARPPDDWFMASEVRWEGSAGRIYHHPDSGAVFLLLDGPVDFSGLRPGIDPDATKAVPT